MAGTVCRVEKNKNYTVMSNHHLKNKQLSLKAKGLLSLMLSLPEEWNYTIEGLAYICQEGVAAIRTAIIELEQEGYVVREQDRTNGHFGKMIYVIYEEPENNKTFPGDNNHNNESDDNSDLDEIFKNSDSGDDSENSMISDFGNTPKSQDAEVEFKDEVSPICDFPMTVKSQKKSDSSPICENLISENPISENQRQLNTNILNTNKQNTEEYVSNVSTEYSDNESNNTNRDQSVEKSQKIKSNKDNLSGKKNFEHESKNQIEQNAKKNNQDKAENIIQIPTKKECEEYKTTAGLPFVNIEKFYDYYSKVGWIENGRQLDWKYKMSAWDLREQEHIKKIYGQKKVNEKADGFCNYQERKWTDKDTENLERRLLLEGQFKEKVV